MQDYGTAWRVLHHSSMIDQLLIKVLRMRNLQHTPQQVADSVEEDALGVINYSIMAIMQYELGVAQDVQTAACAPQEAIKHYDIIVKQIQDLLRRKNNDYGEAWRQMRVLSLCDMLLVKVLRLRQIDQRQINQQDAQGKNHKDSIEVYTDIVNYTVFLLILLNFTSNISSSNSSS